MSVKYITASKVFRDWAKRGRIIFLTEDLKKMFPSEKDDTFRRGLVRLTENNLLTRVARGIYVYPHDSASKVNLLESIATHLRRGEHNYLSLESALSEYGAISQIPTGRITVMTTGRRRTFETPFGVIEFTHTDRPLDDILSGSVDNGRPLRIATLETALRDLKRVGRNTHLIDYGAVEEIAAERSTLLAKDEEPGL